MSYQLIWNKEVIEEGIETESEAEYLQSEYSMAYNGVVEVIQE